MGGQGREGKARDFFREVWQVDRHGCNHDRGGWLGWCSMHAYCFEHVSLSGVGRVGWEWEWECCCFLGAADFVVVVGGAEWGWVYLMCGVGGGVGNGGAEEGSRYVLLSFQVAWIWDCPLERCR